ncbi:MAG: hypothetical protein QOH92_572 [Chloroflexota bacterium]|jgi:hypothetical protein|nr:hypothetical protein [Chloroflexota bacterium]
MFTTANQIHLWAGGMSARSQLPILVRRLVLATLPVVDEIDFPAEESSQFAGWDGVVQTPSSNAHVPQGASGWELGVDSNSPGKADRDYEKRKKKPLELAPKDTSFIFVTARRWAGKKAWRNQRRAEGFWRDVRAYDANDLATWLEQATAVDVWLATALGNRPPGIHHLGHWWEDWSAATMPSLSCELLLAGRTEARQHLDEWLASMPSVLSIRSDTQEEAVAFVAAALINEIGKGSREAALARTVVVESPEAWQQLSFASSPMILIPTFLARGLVAGAVARGHHVLLPIDRAARDSTAMELPQVDAEAAATALVSMGISRSRAELLGAVAHRSLPAVRRQVGLIPGSLGAKWANPDVARQLVPALLAGGWNEDNQADRDAVQALGVQPYSEISETVTRWSHESDAAILKLGTHWTLAWHRDAWEQLRGYIGPDDLDRFQATALRVLGEADPRFDLPADERWLAAVRHRVPMHSSALREGLAETLALLGSVPGVAAPEGGGPRACWIVQQLLDRAASWQAWASVSSYLPLLGEACPDRTLEAVERTLEGEEPLVLKLFTDKGQSPFPSSEHTSLLWALETLSWSPHYFSAVAVILARLAGMATDGRLANRPFASLEGLFRLWYPSTNAPLENRLAVIDTIRQREPDVGWRLLCSLLPQWGAVAMPTARPKFRDWAGDGEVKVTMADRAGGVHQVVVRLLDDVEGKPERWKDVIDGVEQLPDADFDLAMRALRGLDPTQLPPDVRSGLWDSVRSMVANHTQFASAQWALTPAKVAALRQVQDRLSPDDPLLQRAWLFSHTAQLPDPSPGDGHEVQRALDDAREAAVKSLLTEGGIESVLSLAQQVKEPWMVGVALGGSDASLDALNTVTDTVGSDSEALIQMGLAYVRSKASRSGPAWVEKLLSDERAMQWHAELRAMMLTTLEFTDATWSALDHEDEGVKQHYWLRTPIYGRGKISDEAAERVVVELMKAGRHAEAVRFASMYDEQVTPSLLAGTVEAATRSITDTPVWSALTHDIAGLLDRLEKSNAVEESRLARLEWTLLPLLHTTVYEPRVLPRALVRDPGFFVEVLSLIYVSRASGGGETQPQRQPASEEQKAVAQRAFGLLFESRAAPGRRNDGSIDAAEVKRWVSEVHDLAHAAGRGDVGDIHIGQVLAYLPVGSDGVWPHEVVRDLLEEVRNAKIEKGLMQGAFNSRGVVSKDPKEGGLQENAIAFAYQRHAASLANRWPRVARLARDFATNYEGLGIREDLEVEQRGSP